MSDPLTSGLGQEPATPPAIRVTIWNEHVHERRDKTVASIYPDGIHAAIANGLRARLEGPATIRTTTLDGPDNGLSPALLHDTDVLVWWGHKAHDDVADDAVARVREHVLAGMGLVTLHSAHLSKIFVSLMGTTCNLQWRDGDDRELVWTVDPAHPIAQNVPQPLAVGHHEMYGEVFDIPPPDQLVFVSTFTGGEVFRSGCCFHRGRGRIFYFSPGHETYPIYHLPGVQTVLANAVRWAHNPAAATTP